MISVARIIRRPSFVQNIILERTTGGHYEGPNYVANKTIITVRGVLVNPKNSKEIIQTAQGAQAAGYVNIYVDGKTPLYVTRESTDGENNISDVVIIDYQTDFETRYLITNVYDRSKWGFFMAEAQKMGASG